jgi:hypothetical protein
MGLGGDTGNGMRFFVATLHERMKQRKSLECCATLPTVARGNLCRGASSAP